MPMNPLDAFDIGRKAGRARRSTFENTAGDLMENFKTDRDLNSKLLGTLGTSMALEKYKSDLSNQNGEYSLWNETTKSMPGKSTFEQMTSASEKLPPGSDMKTPFGTIRGPYRNVGVMIEDPRNPGSLIPAIDPNTGKPQEMPRGTHVTKKQYAPLESILAKQSMDSVQASFNSLLSDLDKDPDLLVKINTPLLGYTHPIAKSKFEFGRKEMLSEAGGKTLTEGEKRIVNVMFPSLANLVANTKESRIASRYILKTLSEIRKRGAQRIASGDINSVPEFTSDDLNRLQAEAEDEYNMTQYGVNMSANRADVAPDASDTSNDPKARALAELRRRGHKV